MTQATDPDIRDRKTAVQSIAKATEANTKAIACDNLQRPTPNPVVDAKIYNYS